MTRVPLTPNDRKESRHGIEKINKSTTYVLTSFEVFSTMQSDKKRKFEVSDSDPGEDDEDGSSDSSWNPSSEEESTIPALESVAAIQTRSRGAVVRNTATDVVMDQADAEIDNESDFSTETEDEESEETEEEEGEEEDSGDESSEEDTEDDGYSDDDSFVTSDEEEEEEENVEIEAEEVRGEPLTEQ